MNGDVKDARMEQRRLATTIRARGMRVLYTLKIEGALAIQCARRSRIEFWNARFYSSWFEKKINGTTMVRYSNTTFLRFRDVTNFSIYLTF